MERHLHENGTRIIKFFLHLSKEEQRKRFLARIDEPEKNWKFSTGDIAERKFWKQYMQAYEKCLNATSTRHARWYVVPADDKENARLIVSGIILDTFEELKMTYPKTSYLAEAASSPRRWRCSVSLDCHCGTTAWFFVDFWTYGCYNCVNTLPHVVRLYDTYKDRRLVVVGIHTPEFPFEKSTDAVKAAIKRHAIQYPVAQDNEYATWNAYHNQYGPRSKSSTRQDTSCSNMPVKATIKRSN